MLLIKGGIIVSSLKKKIMLIDLICLFISTFFFLYIAPSVEVRQRLLYIIPQVAMCAVIVFASRTLFGVYREYFPDADGKNLTRMYLQLVIADAIACVVYYLVQIPLPHPMRITLLRVVCVIVFNLIEAIVCRLCYHTGFALKEDDRKILEAVAQSGRTTEEIIVFLKSKKP